jgi:hypothetical protein
VKGKVSLNLLTRVWKMKHLLRQFKETTHPLFKETFLHGKKWKAVRSPQTDMRSEWLSRSDNPTNFDLKSQNPFSSGPMFSKEE